MNTEPKISVIVPVYKMEEFLPRCLESLLAQTYRALEIILVDDGSPDGCGRICDEYAARDSRIRVIHAENGGAYAARNLALDIAEGEYIGFVDADDWLHPTMYRTLLELAEEHGADIAQCEMKNEGHYAQTRSQKTGGVAVYHRDRLTEEMFRERIGHALINKIFRAEIFADYRFPEEYYHMDAAFLAGVGSFCRTFVRTDEKLYHYNTSNPSITRGVKRTKHVRSAEKLFEAYSAAADGVPAGSWFICREIPSFGRLILPGGEVSREMAAAHIDRMHAIFLRHWDAARQTAEYRAEPKAKRVLWSIYRRAPHLASALVNAYGRMK